MSDEKSEKSATQIVPKCVDDAAGAIIHPAATQVGQFLSDLLYRLTGDYHLSTEKLRLQHDYELQMFKNGIEEKIREKPENYLSSPKQQIVGQAFEQAKNCLGEKEIREMFEKLIANAADTRYQSLVHPAFPSMISQMSPLDAENLSLFYPNKRFPIVNCRITYEDGGHKTVFSNCFLENPKMQSKDNLELQATSIESLCRLGIVKISYMEWLFDNKQYDKFMTSAPMREIQAFVNIASKRPIPEGSSRVKKATISKGVVELTPLGKTFSKACFTC